MKRRRNKLVLWEWSPGGKPEQPRPRYSRRQASVGMQALGAAALLAVIILVLSQVPDTRPGYNRGNVARFMCVSLGTDPDSPQCFAVAIGGWFLIVVALGIVLKTGRAILRTVGLGRSDDD